MTKQHSLISLELVAVVLASCAPDLIIIDKNYEIGKALNVNVGEEMIVLTKSRQSPGGSQFLQAMADQPVIANVDFMITLTYAGKSGSTIKIAY